MSNEGYRASLSPRKVYEVLDDPMEGHGMIRVIDDTGEDYLFEQDRFVAIDMPKQAETIFEAQPA